MTNSFFGEASIVGVDGKTYKLRLDFNAMCEFEDLTGKDPMVVFSEFEHGNASVKMLRAMMWSFLRRHHPDSTLEFAGDLLSQDVSILEKVLAASVPLPDVDSSEGKPLKSS